MLCHHVGFALTALAVTQTCNTREHRPSNTAGPAPSRVAACTRERTAYQGMHS